MREPNLGGHDKHDPDVAPLPPVAPAKDSAANRRLRIVALVGTGVVLLWKMTSLARIEQRQGLGFLVLIVAAAAIGLTCALVVPAATRLLRRHTDLLVPLGLYITTEALLNALLAIPLLSAMFSPAWSSKVLTLSFSLSLAFLLHLALAVFYSGWTTALIVQAVRQDRVDPAGSLAEFPDWFLRVLGALAFGWGVLFACLAVVIAIGAAFLPLALLLIGGFSLAWNLLTAALLPVIIGERGPFWSSVRKGIRVSREGMSQWWLPVVIQMVLLGWVTFLYVSYTNTSGPGSYSTHNKTDFSVNGFWTGGYENSCRWHTKLMQAVESQPLPFVEFLLSVLLAILAILVKLKITATVYSSAYATEQTGR